MSLSYRIRFAAAIFSGAMALSSQALCASSNKAFVCSDEKTAALNEQAEDEDMPQYRDDYNYRIRA